MLALADKTSEDKLILKGLSLLFLIQYHYMNLIFLNAIIRLFYLTMVKWENLVNIRLKNNTHNKASRNPIPLTDMGSI